MTISLIRMRQALLIAFLPFVTLAAALSQPSFSRPMGLQRPETFLGFPLEVFVIAAAIGWGALGGFYVSRTTSVRAILVAFGLFTIPATLGILFTPGIVLILQNPV